MKVIPRCVCVGGGLAHINASQRRKKGPVLIVPLTYSLLSVRREIRVFAEYSPFLTQMKITNKLVQDIIGNYPWKARGSPHPLHAHQRVLEDL